MRNNHYIVIIKSFSFLTILLVFIIFVYKLSNKEISPFDHNEKICVNFKKEIYNGVIIENFWSRGAFISKFDNNILFNWFCIEKIPNILNIGDSIYKPSGTFDTYIYKNANPDSVIFVECDFDCDYWHKRYGEKRKNLGW